MYTWFTRASIQRQHNAMRPTCIWCCNAQYKVANFTYSLCCGVEMALMKRRMTLIAFGDIALQLQVTSDFHQTLKLAFVSSWKFIYSYYVSKYIVLSTMRMNHHFWVSVLKVYEIADYYLRCSKVTIWSFQLFKV